METITELYRHQYEWKTTQGDKKCWEWFTIAVISYKSLFQQFLSKYNNDNGRTTTVKKK